MSSSWEMKQGPNFAPAYQVSGTPFAKTFSTVDTDVIKITFPYVTRWVSISAQDAGIKALRIGFSENGVNGKVAGQNHYYLLHTVAAAGESSTGRLELRCKELYIRADSGDLDKVSVIAGLTGIESFPVLTGSNGFKGVG